jgi:hypothetical protein
VLLTLSVTAGEPSTDFAALEGARRGCALWTLCRSLVCCSSYLQLQVHQLQIFAALEEGQERMYSVTAKGDGPLIVTLAWMDKEAPSRGAGPVLQNVSGFGQSQTGEERRLWLMPSFGC